MSELPLMNEAEIDELPNKNHQTYLSHPSQIYHRLKLAKYNQSTVHLPANSLIFNDDPKTTGYYEIEQEKVELELLELNGELERCIKEGMVIELRAGDGPEGADQDDAVKLVTDDKSYSLNRVGYSNAMLIVDKYPTTNFDQHRIDENQDPANKPEPQPNIITIQSISNQYLEVKLENPSIKSFFNLVPFFPEKILFENLAEKLKSSDKQLSNLIEQFSFLKLIDDSGSVGNIKFEYISRKTPQNEMEDLVGLVKFVQGKGWHENSFGFDLDEFLGYQMDISEGEVEEFGEQIRNIKDMEPEVTEHYIRCFCEENKNSSANFNLNMPKITSRILHLLMSQARTIKIDELLKVYNEDQSPLFNFPKKEHLSKEACINYLKSSCVLDHNYLKFIPLEELSNEPKNRFDQLFKIKDRWRLEELNVFLEAILNEEILMNGLLNKFCRRVGEKGLGYFVLKNEA